MPRLTWSPRALRDVARLHAFPKPKNPDASVRAIRAIRQGVRLLKTYPEAGQPIDEMPQDYRAWPIGVGSSGYIVLYRYDGRDVVILAIRHAREASY